MEKLEDIAEKSPQKARILLKARMTKILKDNKDNTIGLEYEMGGNIYKEYKKVSNKY